MRMRLLVGLGVLVLVVGCGVPRGGVPGGVSGSASTGVPVSGGVVGVVSVRELHGLFVRDRARGEAECYGRVVTVRGVVLGAGASEFGTPTIEASDVAGGPLLVNIVLPYDDRRAESFRALEGVEVGQEIVATGTCEIFAERTNALVLKGSEIVG